MMGGYERVTATYLPDFHFRYNPLSWGSNKIVGGDKEYIIACIHNAQNPLFMHGQTLLKLHIFWSEL